MNNFLAKKHSETCC